MDASQDYYLKAQKYYTRVHKETKKYQYVNFILLIQCVRNQNYYKDCYKSAYDFMVEQKYPQQRFYVSNFSNVYKNLMVWTTKEQLNKKFNDTYNIFNEYNSGHESPFKSLQQFIDQSNEAKEGLNIIFIITNNNGNTFGKGFLYLKAINNKSNNKLFVLACNQQTNPSSYINSRSQSRNFRILQNQYPEILIFQLSKFKEIGQFFKILIMKKEEFERNQNAIQQLQFKIKSLEISHKIQIGPLKQKLSKTQKLLKQTSQKLKKQIAQLNNEINILKTKEQKYKDSIEQLEQQNLDNLQENNSLKKQINQLKSEVKQKNNQINTMNDQLNKEKQQMLKIFEEKLIEKQQQLKNYLQKQQQIKLKTIFPSSKSVKIYLQTNNKKFLAYKIKIYQINPKDGKYRQLEYQNNQIIIDQLYPSTQYRFEVLLKTTANRQSIYISNPLFYFKTNSPQNIIMSLDLKSEKDKHIYVFRQLESLKNTLELDTDFPELKITLFGSIGQGKSSLLNTFNCIIKGRYVPISDTGNSNKSITKQLRKIRDILSTRIPLSIIDVFGIDQNSKREKERVLNPLEQSNYKQIFDYFFDGSLYGTYKVDQKLDREKLIQSSDGIDRLSRQIHAAIYVISYRILQNKSQIERTKYMLKLLQQRDINAVIALTKCDQLLKNAPISDLQSNQSTKTIIEQFMINFPQVKREDIFIISNYIGKYEMRNYIKEYLVLNMFQEVVIRAKKRLQWKLQKFFWLQKQDPKTYYGLIQQVGLQNYGSRIQQILTKSFQNQNIEIYTLMFRKFKYNFGVKVQKWVTAAEFFKQPLVNFIFEIQNRKRIIIKECHQTEQQKIKIIFFHKGKMKQIKIPKKKGIKTREFYDFIREKHSKILQEYNLLNLNNNEILPQDDTPLKQCVQTEGDIIKIQLQKK